MKTCIRCHQSKPREAFCNYKRYPDGKHRICRVCWNAYSQQWKHAHGTKPLVPFATRLWSRIAICAHGMDCPYCCWPWTHSHDEDGYGYITREGRKTRSHRAVFELWHGLVIPDGLVVMHHCDNTWCNSPYHLRLGTVQDNWADCIAKGRQAKGETHMSVTHPERCARGERIARAKLSAPDVVTIRADYATGTRVATLARRYAVSSFAIRCVILRKTWKHI